MSESIKQLALVFTRKKILGLIKAIQCRIDASRIPLSVELQGMKFNDQDWSINARLTVGTTCAIPVERLEDCGHFVRNHLTVVVGAWGYRQEIHLADSVETGPCIRAPIDSPEQSRR